MNLHADDQPDRPEMPAPFLSVTDPSSDAPDGAVMRFPNGHTYERLGGEWCLLTECTGITATWCPLHGDCSCGVRRDGERTLNDESCPLHSVYSEHGEYTAADDA